MPLRITNLKLLLLLICLLETVSLNAQTLQWARQIASSSVDDCNDVVTDASGNVYVTGGFQNTVDFDPGAGVVNLTSAGIWDIYVCKYSPAGNLLWARRIGGAEEDDGAAIALDASNNVYVFGTFRLTVDFDPGAGTYNMTSAGYVDFFICKLSNTGTFVWARRFGGNQMEHPGDIEIDNAGNVVTTGRFPNTVDFDPGAGVFNLTGGGGDVFVLKLSSAGNFVWAKHIAGTSSVNAERIAEDASGNIYIVGSFDATVDFDPGAAVVNQTAAGSLDGYILKLNSSGNYQWVRRFGGTGYDVLSDITIGSGGTIYSVGYFEATVDFDPGAGTSNLVAAGSRDIVISRLNALGNYVSATRIGGTGEDMGLAIKVDAMGNIYTSGRYSGTVDFNPSGATANRTANGAYDCFILKLGAALNFGWVCTFGGTGGDEGRAISVDPSNNILTAGIFTGTPDFDPNGGVVNFTAQVLDGFIHKLTNPSPLPIQLLNFEAIQNKNTAQLTWQTATETNNDYFTIEKSKDGFEFTEAGTIDGAGNSSAILHYSFIDHNPYPGISYYRLKQNDFNGSYTFSATVTINVKGDDRVIIYPNPAKNVFTVSGFEYNYGDEFKITNAMGITVYSSRVSSTRFNVDVSNLKRGIYFVHIIKTNSSTVTKIVLD